MKRLFFIALVGICPLMSACRGRTVSAVDVPTEQTDRISVSAFTAKALAKSPSFSKLKRQVKHATFVIDEDGPEFLMVGIGEETDTHFSRFKTLKVNKKTGAITRLEMDKNLEDKWVVEFGAQ